MAIDYRYGRVEILARQRQLSVDGQPVSLGSRAFDLLLTLLENRQRVVLKRELLDTVWPDSTVEENNLAVHISALRKLLGKTAITTVPGRGYQFTARLEGWTQVTAPYAEGATATATAAAPARPALPATLPSSVLTSSPARRAPGRTERSHALGWPAPPGEPPLGREVELASLRDQLAGHRLVTLTGGAGMGKSTMALLAASDTDPSAGTQSAAGHLPTAWLDVTLLGDAAALPGRVAHALGLPADVAQDASTLAVALREHAQCLVLDNVDDIPEAVAGLLELLLERCPGMRFLVTCRFPLGVVGERCLQLGPLALPPPRVGLARARSVPSVALFERRARAAHPHFALSEANVQHVAGLCGELQGVPLAIELAVSRLPVMAMATISSRLAASVALLRGEALAESSRQRSRQAALEAGHDRLTPTEQAVFRRLAVFDGGFTTALAIKVARDHAVDAVAIARALQALVRSGMVTRAAVPAAGHATAQADGQADGQAARYGMSASAQDFAMRRLGEAGELDWARRAHLEAVIFALGRASSDFKLLSSESWSARYGDELPNLNAAVHFAIHAAPERALLAYANGRLLLWLEGKHKTLRLLLESLHASITPRTPADTARLVFNDLVLLRDRIARGERRRVVKVLPVTHG